MKLLERDLYLDALDAGLQAVSRGSGSIALVCGEAGIGKTSLIREFLERQGPAVDVLWGGCEALFTPHPLAPLYDIARQAGPEFRAAIAAATNRDVIFNATVDYLARAASITVLVFEDVHWADEATLDLIKFLGRRLQRLKVMLIASYRDDEVGSHHPLRSVIGDLPSGSIHRLLLPALSADAVAALAQSAGRRPGILYEATGGNPFFVTEALAVSGEQVPTTVRDAVLARISRLSSDAREIANVVSAVPGKAEHWLIEKAMPIRTEALQECLSAGMIALADNCIAFRHELARRAIEESLAPPLRAALHARILGALLGASETEVPVARLVHHADKAGDSAAVLRFAPAAAERAACLGAHREAAAHYAAAIAHAGAVCTDMKAELLDRASYECYLTDQIDAAIEARQASLELWRSAGNRLKEGDALRWLSRLLWFGGRRYAADQYAADAIAVLEPLGSGRELAMAYSNCSQLHMLAEQAEEALVWGNKAIAMAVALGDTEIESHALNNVGAAKQIKDDASGHGDMVRSLEHALAGDFQEHAARAYTNLGCRAVRERQLSSASRYLDEGIVYCEDRDLGSWERYMTALRAECHLALGNWQKAADDAEALLRHPRGSPVSRIPALIVLARARARRGDPGVKEPLDEAFSLAKATGELQRLGPIAIARAEQAWLEGTPEEAVTPELRHCYELALENSDQWMKGELAFWLWRGAVLEPIPARIAAPFALAIAGDWRAAARAWEALGCPYEQAMALAETGAENDARTALQIFERLGATPMFNIVRRDLRAVGIRKVPRGAHQRTKDNPYGLTNRELHVLGLLAEGCRNADIARRLFVADKTVDHHVSAILAKLKVGSRGEAAAIANRLGVRAPVKTPRRESC